MEKPIFPTNTRRLKYALTTLALFTALAAIPAYFQTSSGETNALPPMPPIWSILEDADQDGMTDVDELLWGMDPLDPSDGLSDLDGDDIPLSWEFAIGTNPDMADTDMDDWSDSEEYLLYGTDPLDPLSFPEGGTPESGGTTDPPNPPGDISDPEPTPPPSLSNGDFSNVGNITTWKSMLTSTEYQGHGFEWNAGAIGSWTAYFGSTVEVWNAGGEKFVELDGSPGNYGIKQAIANAMAGGHVLAWRESGRNSTRAGSDPYRVRVYYMNGTSEVQIGQSAEFSGFSKMQWKDNAFGFQITPAQLAAAGTNPIYVAFIPTGSLNTYGTLIDKVRFVPIEVAVDANRDGEITFDAKDKTTAEKPFRFWINNDQDNVDKDEPSNVTLPDSAGADISTKRDLEDFCRLRISIGIDNAQLRSGNFLVGVKFAGGTPEGPSIRCWENQSLEGDNTYLTNADAAARQIALTWFNRSYDTGITMIPSTYWAMRNDSNANIIFEGVERGVGKLVVTIHDANGVLLGEGGETWIKLLDVREMYQRARIVNEAEQIPEPWVNQYPPAQTWLWDPNGNQYIEDPNATNQTVIFVHGWRLTYKTYLNWADTSYKRLWHQGFNGKFYTFRWATFSGDNNGLPDEYDDWLEGLDLGSVPVPRPGVLTYNPSEYRAWLCGPALANYVNQLPNLGRRSLFAHSMGNVIAGSALRSGMNIDHYALCNAAVSAMCYDSSSLLHGNANIWWPLTPEYLRVTPDTNANPWLRQYGLNNKFNYNNLQMHNFTLSEDNALSTWILNNQIFKPELSTYSYKPHDTSLTWPLNFQPFGIPPRPVYSLPEAMSYVTKSLTAPVGRTPSTRGAIDSTVGMDSWFVDLHSAQWRLNYLQTNQFWFNLKKELRLDVK